MEPSPTFPISLTRQELETFNQFWQNLSPSDREALDDLIQSVTRHWPAIDHAGYLPYQAFLLSLLIEEHKEVGRLRRQVEDFAYKKARGSGMK